MSHEQKIAKSFGVELSEEVQSISTRRGKKKKKKKNILNIIQEPEIVPTATPEKSGSISIDNLTGLGDNSINDNRDPTILIMEDDYGDENVLAPLLRDDGPTDYIPMREGSAAGGVVVETTQEIEALDNSELLKKIMMGSFA